VSNKIDLSDEEKTQKRREYIKKWYLNFIQSDESKLTGIEVGSEGQKEPLVYQYTIDMLSPYVSKDESTKLSKSTLKLTY
jgi:hypothetical protein